MKAMEEYAIHDRHRSRRLAGQSFICSAIQRQLANTQALKAVTVGMLANLHFRLLDGLRIAIIHPTIYISVPGSLAA